MKINLVRVVHKRDLHLKAEFTAEVEFEDEAGKCVFTFPRLKAISGAKGLYVTIPGEVEKDSKEDTAPKYKTTPYFYYNKPVKEAIEMEIAKYLSKVDKES